MNLYEWLLNGGSVVAIILTIIQIAPIKVNPWNKIARTVGKHLSGDVLDKIDENEANNSRYRILRFDDEIRHEQLHTEEHFNQILDDIKTYESYCKDHPNYPNDKAKFAIEKIRQTYHKCRDNNTFL